MKLSPQNLSRSTANFKNKHENTDYHERDKDGNQKTILKSKTVSLEQSEGNKIHQNGVDIVDVSNYKKQRIFQDYSDKFTTLPDEILLIIVSQAFFKEEIGQFVSICERCYDLMKSVKKKHPYLQKFINSGNFEGQFVLQNRQLLQKKIGLQIQNGMAFKGNFNIRSNQLTYTDLKGKTLTSAIPLKTLLDCSTYFPNLTSKDNLFLFVFPTFNSDTIMNQVGFQYVMQTYPLLNNKFEFNEQFCKSFDIDPKKVGVVEGTSIKIKLFVKFQLRKSSMEDKTLNQILDDQNDQKMIQSGQSVVKFNIQSGSAWLEAQLWDYKIIVGGYFEAEKSAHQIRVEPSDTTLKPYIELQFN